MVLYDYEDSLDSEKIDLNENESSQGNIKDLGLLKDFKVMIQLKDKSEMEDLFKVLKNQIYSISNICHEREKDYNEDNKTDIIFDETYNTDKFMRFDYVSKYEAVEDDESSYEEDSYKGNYSFCNTVEMQVFSVYKKLKN